MRVGTRRRTTRDPGNILTYVPEVNVPEIIAYGKQKGVKVLLWLYWGAIDKQMDAALDLYAKWGAAGHQG